MKIHLNLYKDTNFGNCRFDTIFLTTNKMPVSFLKNIISQRFEMDKSSIILSVKLHNLHFVLMADDFPLFFYNIKDNSTIYVELVEKPNKTEEIVKKLKERENKSNLLKKLGIFKKRDIDIIKESALEDIDIESEDESDIKINEDDDDDSFSKNDNINEDKKNLKELPKIIEQKFFNAIINNKLEVVREILKHYKDLIDINKPIGKSQKYSPIHYVSLLGYSEMMKDMVQKYNADVNLLSTDGWSPLHLCAFMGNMNILKIFIKLKKLKPNITSPNLGTPVHCASKQNHLSILSLLLTRSNPEIKNDEGLLPVELSKNKNIIRLINKVVKGQNYFEEENLVIPEVDNSSKHEKVNNQLEKYTFYKDIKNIPTCPPRYVGFCYKKQKSLFSYNARYLELNASKDSFLRFKFKEDYPFKVKESLNLSSIKSCKTLPNSEKDNYFFIELICDDGKQLLRFESLKVCNLWVDKINSSIDYSKFWKKIEKKYKDVQTYLNTIKSEIFEIDYFSGDIRKFELTQEEKERQKNKAEEINQPPANKTNNTNEKGNNTPNVETSNINMFQLNEIFFICNLYKIYKVKHKDNGNYYLMKVFSKKNLTRIDKLKYLNSQINEQKQLNFLFCLPVTNTIQMGDNLYLISDYCPNENLSYYQNRILFDENSIKISIAEIILAIEYLHKMEFSFNNLSLENIFITKDNHVNLANLRLRKINFTYNDGVRIGAEISEDIYAIGAIIYELVSGIPPFYISNVNFISKKKTEELYVFNYFSDNLKDLLAKLLCKEPDKRIGVKNKKEIKSHPWFKNINWDSLLIKSTNPSINFSLIKNEIQESFLLKK